MSSVTHTNVWTLERFSTLFRTFVDMKPFAGKREKFDSFLSFFDMTSKTFPLLYHIITVKLSLFQAYYEGLLRTKYRMCIYLCYVACIDAMRNKSMSKHVRYKLKMSGKTKGCSILLKDVRYN